MISELLRAGEDFESPDVINSLDCQRENYICKTVRYPSLRENSKFQPKYNSQDLKAPSLFTMATNDTETGSEYSVTSHEDDVYLADDEDTDKSGSSKRASEQVSITSISSDSKYAQKKLQLLLSTSSSGHTDDERSSDSRVREQEKANKNNDPFNVDGYRCFSGLDPNKIKNPFTTSSCFISTAVLNRSIKETIDESTPLKGKIKIGLEALNKINFSTEQEDKVIDVLACEVKGCSNSGKKRRRQEDDEKDKTYLTYKRIMNPAPVTKYKIGDFDALFTPCPSVRVRNREPDIDNFENSIPLKYKDADYYEKKEYKAKLEKYFIESSSISSENDSNNEVCGIRRLELEDSSPGLSYNKSKSECNFIVDYPKIEAFANKDDKGEGEGRTQTFTYYRGKFSNSEDENLDSIKLGKARLASYSPDSCKSKRDDESCSSLIAADFKDKENVSPKRGLGLGLGVTRISKAGIAKLTSKLKFSNAIKLAAGDHVCSPWVKEEENRADKYELSLHRHVNPFFFGRESTKGELFKTPIQQQVPLSPLSLKGILKPSVGRSQEIEEAVNDTLNRIHLDVFSGLKSISEDKSMASSIFIAIPSPQIKLSIQSPVKKPRDYQIPGAIHEAKENYNNTKGTVPQNWLWSSIRDRFNHTFNSSHKHSRNDHIESGLTFSTNLYTDDVQFSAFDYNTGISKELYKTRAEDEIQVFVSDSKSNGNVNKITHISDNRKPSNFKGKFSKFWSLRRKS